MTAQPTAGLKLAIHEPGLGLLSAALFSPCGNYRYQLTRSWDPDRRAALFILLNPSTADAFTDDPTIRRVVRYAQSWGCGSIIVVNLFALRATDPRDMLRHPGDPVGPENDAVITTALAFTGGPVVAGWGVNGSHLGRDTQVLELARRVGRPVQCLGVTTAGQPKHPLYLARTEPLRPLHPAAG